MNLVNKGHESTHSNDGVISLNLAGCRKYCFGWKIYGQIPPTIPMESSVNPLNEWDNVRARAYVAAQAAAPWLFGQKSGVISPDIGGWLIQPPCISAKGRLYGAAVDFLEREILSLLSLSVRLVCVGSPPRQVRRRDVQQVPV